MHPPLIAPSILSADFSNLAEECKRIIYAGADILHVDIMDGHSSGLSFNGHKSRQGKTFTGVSKWVQPLSEAGASIFTFHYEAEIENIESLSKEIRCHNMKVGMAIKPQTQVFDILPLLHLLDTVLVMSVEPGFGGQKFMPEALFKALIKDGGINLENVSQIVQAGANIIVAGSSIFSSKDPSQVIRQMKTNKLNGE